MLVCQRFRSVAVRTPQLWNTIYIADNSHYLPSQAHIDWSIARARSIPLVLLGSADHLVSLLTRAGRVDFQPNGGDVDPVYMEQPTPYLQDLSLRNDYFCVAKSLIGGQSTKLVRLCLERVILVELPTLPALTHLELVSATMYGNLDALAGSLKCTPNLEVLVVKNIYVGGHLQIKQPAEVIPIHARVDIELESLKVLQIHDNPPVVSAILRTISRPTMALYVQVVCREKGGNHSACLRLNANYDVIIEHCNKMWRAFSTLSVRPPCTLFYGCDRDYRSVIASAVIRYDFVEFGRVFALNEQGNISQEEGDFQAEPYLYCSMECTIIERPDIVEMVTCLHLEGDGQSGAAWDGLHENIRLHSSVNQVVIANHVDAEDLSGIESLLRERTRQECVTVHTISCSEEVQDHVNSWLDTPSLMVKEADHGQDTIVEVEDDDDDEGDDSQIAVVEPG